MKDIYQDNRWSKGAARYGFNIPRVIPIKQSTTAEHQGDTH